MTDLPILLAPMWLTREMLEAIDPCELDALVAEIVFGSRESRGESRMEVRPGSFVALPRDSTTWHVLRLIIGPMLDLRFGFNLAMAAEFGSPAFISDHKISPVRGSDFPRSISIAVIQAVQARLPGDEASRMAGLPALLEVARAKGTDAEYRSSPGSKSPAEDEGAS